MNGTSRTRGSSWSGGEYTAAFVEIAVARGWRREDAGTWPVGIGDEAFIEAYLYDSTRRAAAADVIACEEPPCLSD